MSMATSENESEWLQTAFLEDHMAVKMEPIQDRQFLCSGVKPTAGQRVELKIFLNPEFVAGHPSETGKTTKKSKQDQKDKVLVGCSFSGQVTRVKPEPAKWFPQSDIYDQKGSKALSVFLGTKVFCSPTISTTEARKLPPNSTLSPCVCSEEGCNVGELYLPQQDWEQFQDQAKLDLSFALKMFGGVKHGQEVVCEGRLNFDYDSTYRIRLHLLPVATCLKPSNLILFPLLLFKFCSREKIRHHLRHHHSLFQ
jgi:hypothetical protein